jgi:hypothetical protein
LPNSFRAAAELVLNVDLRRAVEGDGTDPEEVQRLLDEARGLGVTLDTNGLGYALERSLEGLLERLREQPEDPDLLRRVEANVALVRSSPFKVDLWRAQNCFYEMRRTVFPAMQRAAEQGSAAARAWVEGFRKVAEGLNMRTD